MRNRVEEEEEEEKGLINFCNWVDIKKRELIEWSRNSGKIKNLISILNI